ncbi:ComEC/Rec2 family competence protein [Granulicella sp. dw_53]|uniref:ComEC/Rec2 family competence protein n=1 Tax=Granulicella sp. dw_53 TaxID=2719792 RepID=UPI001BD698B2|nr:ComEC/Rec2 family competence protein [Granulicella sp. dw_53]
MRSAGRASTTEFGKIPPPELWERGSTPVQALEFRRAPLLAAAVWFAVGEVMARSWRPMVMLLVALGLLAGLTVVVLRGHLRVVLVPLAAVWMVVGMAAAEVQPVPQQQRSLLRYADGLSRAVRGRVVRVRMLAPRKAADEDADGTEWHEAEPPGAMSVDVQVEAVEEVTPDVSRMVPMEGGLRVTVTSRGDALPSLKCGDWVAAPMQLRVPERYRDPGAWQYADYLLTEGIGAHASVRAGRFKKLGEGTGSVQCKIYAAQSWAVARLDGYVRSAVNRRLPSLLRLSEGGAGMLKAMLFGDRAGLTQPQRIGFQRTGSFHLFVVSGMHVTLLAAAVFWMARRMRLREWIATLLTVGLASAYAVLTGFGAPVQRALWMTAIFLVARLLARDRNVLNGLGAAALGVLVWSPGSLFEASFQMTFLAVMAIGGIAVPLGERSVVPYARAARKLREEWIDLRLRPRVAQFRVMLRVWGEALVSVLGEWAYGVPALFVRVVLWAAELAMLGLVVEAVMVLPMAVYFHRATPFALPANMLSVPMVAVLAPMGVLTFVGSLVSPWVAALPGATTALLLHGVTGTVSAMSRVRVADVRVPGPAGWVVAIALVAWVFCCWAVRRREKGWAWVAVVVLPAVAVLVLWPEAAVVSPGMLEVTAVDVGQGDSLLVVSPQGQTMLVDAGGPVGSLKESAEAQSAFDVGEEVVSPYLWSRRMRRLDVIALSHAHSDHMGGMAAVMRSFRPRELWVSVDADSQVYRALLEEAAELGVVVRHYHAGDRVEWSGVGIEVLSPAVGYGNPGEPKNDDSLVMRLRYGKASVLMEGDAEAPSERAMVASGLSPVTLLKVGHHGSRTSTTPEFFAALRPTDAVISVGRANTFGHPRGEVIERIAEGHTRLYRTDEFGLTTFLLDRDGGIREVVGGEDLR